MPGLPQTPALDDQAERRQARWLGSEAAEALASLARILAAQAGGRYAPPYLVGQVAEQAVGAAREAGRLANRVLDRATTI